MDAHRSQPPEFARVTPHTFSKSVATSMDRPVNLETVARHEHHVGRQTPSLRFEPTGHLLTHAAGRAGVEDGTGAKVVAI